MHTNRISPARKIIVWLAAVAGLVFFAGCETVTLTDLTPGSMPANPSQLYTFALRVTPRSNTVTGVAPQIVVDGKSHRMKRSPLGEGIYEFEYRLPPGQDQLKYYYLVNYNVEGNNVASPRETYTEVKQVDVVNRYVLSLEMNRGPVGSRVAVLGRGFTPQDSILFDGAPARTVMESPNALSFYVPALDPNRNYQVTLSSPAGNSPVGTFRIDSSSVTVSPSSLTLRTGEEQALTFTILNPAPPGGTLLDVTTDIPESVIMPEVVVPAGQTYASVQVRGGRPGTGNLYLKGFGGGEVVIPITVTAQ